MVVKGKNSQDPSMMAGQPDAKKAKLDAMRTKASLEVASRFMDSPLTINSKPMHAPLSAVPASHRYLGSEIQCLMHAFGEVRFCAKEVLEMVEDAVREAAQNAVHVAADIGARKGSYSKPRNSSSRGDTRSSPPSISTRRESLADHNPRPCWMHWD